MKPTSRGIRAATFGFVAGALALSMPYGVAQDAATPPQQPNLSAAPNPDRPAPQSSPQHSNPGLIQEIGRLFERGAASVRSQFDGTKKPIDSPNQTVAPPVTATSPTQTIGDTAIEVGKTAAGVMVAPLTSRIINGHERCGTAPNGAPDCVTAAQALCKRHGYRTGKSMDFTSAEQCVPAVYLAGRENAPVCTTITFISSAMCQ